MKAKYLFALFAIITLTATVSAQVDRSIAPEQYRRRPSKNAKPVDFIQQAVDYYKKELKLDDFQAAAIREVMEDERENLTSINTNNGATVEERKDRAKAIFDRIDSKILPLLSPDQQTKYKEIRKIQEEKEVELESD